MTLVSYADWLLEQRTQYPDADLLGIIIRNAGPNGLTRAALGKQVEIHPRILDELLMALQSLGEICMERQGEDIVVRSMRKLGGYVGM